MKTLINYFVIFDFIVIGLSIHAYVIYKVVGMIKYMLAEHKVKKQRDVEEKQNPRNKLAKIFEEAFGSDKPLVETYIPAKADGYDIADCYELYKLAPKIIKSEDKKSNKKKIKEFEKIVNDTWEENKKASSRILQMEADRLHDGVPHNIEELDLDNYSNIDKVSRKTSEEEIKKNHEESLKELKSFVDSRTKAKTKMKK